MTYLTRDRVQHFRTHASGHLVADTWESALPFKIDLDCGDGQHESYNLRLDVGLMTSKAGVEMTAKLVVPKNTYWPEAGIHHVRVRGKVATSEKDVRFPSNLEGWKIPTLSHHHKWHTHHEEHLSTHLLEDLDAGDVFLYCKGELLVDTRVLQPQMSEEAKEAAADSKPVSRIDSRESFLGSLSLKLDSNSCTDFTLVSDTHSRVPCHRLVLAARSEIFEAMFNSKMKEPIERELKLPLDGNCLDKFVDYMYGREKGYKMDSLQEVRQLMPVADMYNLEGLKEVCRDAMHQCLNEETLFETISMARLFNCPGVKRATVKFLGEKIHDIVEKPKIWEVLVKEHDDVLKEVLRNMTFKM